MNLSHKHLETFSHFIIDIIGSIYHKQNYLNLPHLTLIQFCPKQQSSKITSKVLRQQLGQWK